MTHLAVFIEFALQGLHPGADLSQTARHCLIVRGVCVNGLPGILIHNRLTQEVNKVDGLIYLQATNSEVC
jgi:hypothetical protein